jgi:pyridoxamine 5'-phosphate oxidase
MMNSILINGLNFTLTDIEKDCWHRILNGSVKSKDPMHNPVVGNITNAGVNMRTVVLRKVVTEEKKLFFHTDVRSGKWQDLEKNENISWLFYDAAGRTQIRIGGTASLHHNDSIANEAWQKTYVPSRKVYLGEDAPSKISLIPTSGLSDFLNINNPTEEESDLGRKNFGVVCTNTFWMEWLWLSSNGHKRAEFIYDKNNGTYSSNWLIP